MPDFISGLELSNIFYKEGVRPILEIHFPNLVYAAARIGHGSEVLGFDDEMSRDHDWGPRLTLFLNDEDCILYREPISDALRFNLPPYIYGYSTQWSIPGEDGTLQLEEPINGRVNHRVEIVAVKEYIQDSLGFNIEKDIEIADWLSFPQQKLLALTSGEVYHDEVGLQSLRKKFHWYPDDVWLYLLAAGWARIGQEEHLMGRAGYVGDELGSAIIASRLVRDLMRLCFLMEKSYAPYPKWFGSAFCKLKCANNLLPRLIQVVTAPSWQIRQEGLSAAYEMVAEIHNQLGITDPLPGKVESFYGRPFQVIWGERYAEAIRRKINNPDVSRIAKLSLIGSLDLFSDNTDLLEDPLYHATLRSLYTY